MKHLILFLLIAGFSTFNVKAQSTWKIDPVHSTIEFVATHLVYFDIRGAFEEYDITVKSRRDDFVNAEVEVSIDVKSLDSRNSDRDEHLRSDDFFAAERYPKMTFKSKSLRKVGDKYRLVGDLTIRGITKEVTLDVTYQGSLTDPWGNQRAGFKVVGEVNRFDFDIKWNNLLDNGGLMVGETVRLECSVQFVKQ